jgi:hypothetical protein
MHDEKPPVTYRESLSVAWLLIWRGVLINVVIGAVLGAVVGFVLGVAGRGELVTPIAGTAGLVGGVFIGAPLVIRMMFKKRFSGFRVQLAREPA